ncbi:DUF3427 domain-containing protein [Peribacillus frigoritolerans]|uniref:DUF3427 domain-containing protein n=1 Tax=Peribacillus frigoritolerans TaxID=450367 RepID=UPI003519A6CF
MARNLLKYQNYTRKEVHDIFDPSTNFLPQRGTWGLQGIIPIPDRENDFVFFVTIGRVEGHHAFDEGITTDGVLTWQSQPKQKREDKKIKAFIKHNHNMNNIYLFLRTNSRNPSYNFLGKLAYLSHDTQREQPVYFKWQILDWDLSSDQANQIGLILDNSTSIKQHITPGVLVISDPPFQTNTRIGQTTSEFRGKHVNFDLNNKMNKRLGNLGELMVVKYEKDFLIRNGKPELAEMVNHTAKTEGDGTGYDIRSYNLNGEIKYIEVKTTRAGKNTPFYLSIRELLFSKQHPKKYFLYRIFDFDETSNSGAMYMINGDLEQHLNLEPLTFKASK